jgi:hypothetical protein
MTKVTVVLVNFFFPYSPSLSRRERAPVLACGYPSLARFFFFFFFL